LAVTGGGTGGSLETTFDGPGAKERAWRVEFGAGALVLLAITLGRDGGLRIGCVEACLRVFWILLAAVFGPRNFTGGNSRPVELIPTAGG